MLGSGSPRPCNDRSTAKSHWHVRYYFFNIAAFPIDVCVPFTGAACSPANSRPDPSINLEICELINEKQGTL